MTEWAISKAGVGSYRTRCPACPGDGGGDAGGAGNGSHDSGHAQLGPILPGIEGGEITPCTRNDDSGGNRRQRMFFTVVGSIALAYAIFRFWI
jgi:hypothetical protein